MKFVDHFLQSHTKSLPSYVKNTSYFINRINETKNIQSDTILVTFTMLMFSCKWCRVNWLTIICDMPSPMCKVGVDQKTLNVSKLSFILLSSFNKLSKIVYDGKYLVSFVNLWLWQLLYFDGDQDILIFKPICSH